MDAEGNPGLEDADIVRYHQGGMHPVKDVVAREEPLEVRLNGSTLVYLMRLPGDDALLAAGFCLSEGLIERREQIELIRHCSEGEEDTGNVVEITARAVSGAERFGVARVIRTGCGGADLDRDLDLSGVKVESGTTFSPEVINKAPDMLLDGQAVFRVTGGTHGAGVFDAKGRMVTVKEDVGRHNAVDKAIGYMLLSDEGLSEKGLILSGRLSYEMVLKGARAGIPLLCSVSAPTALGVDVGGKTGVTLVGFLRSGSFNVYSHPERIGAA